MAEWGGWRWEGRKLSPEEARRRGRRGGRAVWAKHADTLLPHPRLPHLLIPYRQALALKSAATMRANGHYRRMGEKSGAVRRARKAARDAA